MKRRNRLILTALSAAFSVALVVLLVLAGNASEGPVAGALRAIGSALSGAEARVARQVRGPGRAGSLAWLEPLRRDAAALRAPDSVLLGAYDASPNTLEGVLRLERALGKPLALVHIYTAWGDKPEQRFPARMVQAIGELGSIPVITWEPWLTDFESRLHPHLPLRQERERGGLASVARGDYDFYIDEWAREAAATRRTLLLRFAHEMNDPYRYPWGPQNNQVADFLAAWRHVVGRFRAAGAHNVVWVWSPHIAYADYESFYPGDDVVDWIGTGTLNYGTVANWSQWWTFQEIFGQRYARFALLNKPIMLAELSSLAVGGDRAQWFRDALEGLPARHPQIKAVLFFHVPADQTVTYQALDWSFARDSAALAAIREALATW